MNNTSFLYFFTNVKSVEPLKISMPYLQSLFPFSTYREDSSSETNDLSKILASTS